MGGAPLALPVARRLVENRGAVSPDIRLSETVCLAWQLAMVPALHED